MWKPILIIILIFGVLAGLYYYYNKPEIISFDDSPINTNKTPRQTTLFRPKSIEHKTGLLNLSINPMARYSISARVLAKRRYVRGWESEISPWDIVFGWGEAADETKTENLRIKQAVRWYSFRIKGEMELSAKYISRHTSNNHIIPANNNIRKVILFLQKSEIVYMEGYLVNVSGKKGNQNIHWNTSLSRDDTGMGACEIFYVDLVKIGNKVYK